MSHNPHSNRGREEFLDAARGAAMLFVLLSHFGTAYFSRGEADRFWEGVLIRIGMIASPTFTIVSGLVLGYLLSTTGARFGEIRMKLIDRSLFLLTIGHLLIAGALWKNSELISFMRTDCIAVSVIIGALIIQRTSALTRLMLGVLIYVLSWVTISFWAPGSAAGNAVERVAFGAFDVDNFPLIPWFSLYIGSTAFGQWLAKLEQAEVRRVAVNLAKLSIACVSVAGLFELVKHAEDWELVQHPVLRHLMWVGQKYPPGPVYLLLYGGIGLAILATSMLAQSTGRSRSLRWLAATGKCAFFIYVIHFYLFDALYLIKVHPASEWPLFFLASCLVIGVVADRWQRRNGNRWLTVGLPWIASYRQRLTTLAST